ncbi:MAG: NAD(+) synthase [Thermomicrobiales bacterium]
MEEISNAIAAWLKRHFDNAGAKTFVLGLSGGIDSALVSALCTKAVGSDKVLGIIMPSSSNPDDAVSAQKVADAFGFRTVRVDLTGIADSIYAAVPSESDLGVDAIDETVERRRQLATANVRPRLRMTTNYYVANLTGGIVVGTGNKSEATIGYYTKYGDGGVDLLPLIDLYKFEVRALARHLGVPETVITRPPSAGLWDGQTDETEIGMSYETLDTSLMAIADGRERDVAPDILARLKPLIAASWHKRNPVPTFIKSDNGL